LLTWPAHLPFFPFVSTRLLPVTCSWSLEMPQKQAKCVVLCGHWGLLYALDKPWACHYNHRRQLSWSYYCMEHEVCMETKCRANLLQKKAPKVDMTTLYPTLRRVSSLWAWSPWNNCPGARTLMARLFLLELLVPLEKM
jgi:hypothetical protein